MSHIKIDIDIINRRPAIVWARETFGMPRPVGVRFCDMRWWHRDIDAEYGNVIPRFYFKNPEDATMFALKWQ